MANSRSFVIGAAAAGGGYMVFTKPSELELEQFRDQALFGRFVEQRALSMSVAERREFDAFMRWPRRNLKRQADGKQWATDRDLKSATITDRWGISRGTPSGTRRQPAACSPDSAEQSAGHYTTMKSPDHSGSRCFRTDSDA